MSRLQNCNYIGLLRTHTRVSDTGIATEQTHSVEVIGIGEVDPKVRSDTW